MLNFLPMFCRFSPLDRFLVRVVIVAAVVITPLFLCLAVLNVVTNEFFGGLSWTIWWTLMTLNGVWAVFHVVRRERRRERSTTSAKTSPPTPKAKQG